MESVTRAFYTRHDLDLILTSPVPPQKIFAVRIARIAAGVAAVALFLASPFINMLAILGGARWLAAYGVVAVDGARRRLACRCADRGAVPSDRAKRTRLIAQIVAAVIGAAFVIGLQMVAILSYGSLSRYAPLQSHWLIAHAPGSQAASLWLPARAVLGDLGPLFAVTAASLALLGAAIAAFCQRFGEHVIAAAGVSHSVVRQRAPRLPPRHRRRCPAPQGMDAAGARSLAGVAEPDADSLSLAAGVAAVAQLPRWRRRFRPLGAGVGDGGGAACRRSCLAVDLRRGRARSRRLGADLSAAASSGPRSRR